MMIFGSAVKVDGRDGRMLGLGGRLNFLSLDDGLGEHLLVEGADSHHWGGEVNHLGDGLEGSEVFDFLDLVVEDLVVHDFVLEEELLLQGNGEEILFDEVLLHVDHVEHVHVLVEGVDGLELVEEGELVVSVHHTGNQWVHLVHHLFAEDEFFWEDGLVGLVSEHHLVEEDILDELISEDGGVHGLVGVDWVVDLVSEDGGVEGLEGGVDWVGGVLVGEVLLGEEMFLDEFLRDVVQVSVDLDQEGLEVEVILELEFIIVHAWDKEFVLQEITFEARDDWEEILVHDHVTLDQLISKDGGGDGDVGLEEVDNGVDVLVEVDRVQEVLLEGGDLPELLEVDGGDELLEGWVLDVLTEEGKAHVFTEELGLVQLIDGEDLLVQKLILKIHWHINVVTVDHGLLHGVTQFLQQELAHHGAVELVKEGLLLLQLEQVHGGLAGNSGHQESGNNENLHVE
jgi:hypothetical protein